MAIESPRYETIQKAKELETWLNENKYPKKTGFAFAQYNPP